MLIETLENRNESNSNAWATDPGIIMMLHLANLETRKPGTKDRKIIREYREKYQLRSFSCKQERRRNKSFKTSFRPGNLVETMVFVLRRFRR